MGSVVKFLVFPSSGDLEPVDMSGRVLFVVWALVADRVLTGGHGSGFASCLAGRSGRLDAHIRSGLLKVEQQGLVRSGGGTGASAKSALLDLLEGEAAAVSQSQARSAIRSLSSRGLETGGTRGEVMVLDYRCLASRPDLSSLHALQASLVWVRSVVCRKLWSVGRSVGQAAVRGQR